MRNRLLYTFFLVLLVSAGCNYRNGKKADTRASAEVEALIAKATQLDDIGDNKRAKLYLDSAFRSKKKRSVEDWYYYYHYYFRYHHNLVKDDPKALVYVDSMIALLSVDTQYYSKILAEAFYAKGDAYFTMHKYDESYKYIYDARTLVRANLDPCGLSDYNYRLGMITYKQKRYNDAKDYFIEAYANFGACRDVFIYFYRKQELLDNIGLCYTKLLKPDSALFYFNKTLSILETDRYKYPEKKDFAFTSAKAVVYGNMADVFNMTGHLDSAEHLYNKSIDINKQPLYDNYDAQRTRIKLAAMYLKDDRVKTADKVLDTIKQLLVGLPDNGVRIDWYNLKSKVLETYGEHKQALSYLRSYKNLADSVEEDKRELIETDVNERFKNLDKVYQVDTLKKNAQIRQNFLLLMVSAILFTIILVIMLLVNRRRSRRNISKLERLNEIVNQRNRDFEIVLKDLTSSNNEKDRILRVLAHDIRNPIAAIISLADIMQTESAGLSEDQQEYLNLISEASVNALTLTKDILDASTIANNIEKEWVDVNGLLTNSVSLLRFKAEEKDQIIQLHKLDVPLQLYVDKEKIWRVINNLAVNAIKFSEHGSVIHIYTEVKGNELIIAVKDNGVGIPEKYRDNIFEMFTDAKRPGTAGEKSYGLGLSICKQIIESHDGTITFTTEEGKGSTFFVHLPIVDNPPV